MKLKKSIVASLAAACAMFYSGAALAAPTISNFSPNATYQFQTTNTFRFTVASSTGVTGLNVQLTAKPITGGSTVLSYLTVGSGLTVSGSSTSETVAGPLMSNELYSVVIQAIDASGTNSVTTNFDTINPAYTWEAEDYDYTGGQFIDNPQVNQYSGLAATSGTDFQHAVSNGGSSTYRPQGLTVETTSDALRVQHGGLQDYDVGYNNGGDYANYSRHYPAGTYYVFLRGAGGNGAQADCASLTVNGGTATINGSGPYQFSIPASPGGWQGWSWDPMIDKTTGNPAQITFGSGVNTLRVTIDGGNCNENCYMLVPTNANAAAGSVVITNLYPDGLHQFEQTSALTFTANSPLGVDTNSILVQLAGTSLSGNNSSAIYTPGNGLVLTGSGNSVNVSFPNLASNTTYTAFVQVLDLSGGVTTTSVSFDTVSPSNYTFEAEDYNYQGGQFFDNPQTNAYFNPDPNDLSAEFDGVVGVDYFYPAGQSQNVGGYKYDRYGLSVEVCSDKTRVQYGGTNSSGGVVFTNTDYDVGYTTGGIWANYTRHFPAGQYNIYMRAANGNATAATPDSCTLSFVTSDPTQPNQTTAKIGTFTVPGTGGWQNFVWVPLANSAGTILPVTLTGNEQTLQMLMDGSSYNANYFMLVPVSGFVKVPPSIDTYYPDGRTLLQGTNALIFTVDSAIGISGSGVSVLLNGVNVTNLTFSGTSMALNVNCPLQTNVANNVAIITMTDNYGSTTFTDRFDTFGANALTFEAEDFDYNGGQYFDFINGVSQINAYNGDTATANIDVNSAANGDANGYRPSLGVETTSDLKRAVYVADNNAQDYDLGYNNGGYWENYTRTYPAGIYNVYLRGSNPNTQPIQNDAANLSIVTSGAGTTSQTTSQLGTFSVPYSGDWQKFNWVPLLDTHGNLARVTFTGTTNTLRVTVDGGNFNANLYVLAPADLNIPAISNVSPSGTTIFQSSNALTFVVSSPAGIATNAITVTVNGVTVASSNLVFTGSSTSWNVSDPSLPANTLCTAIITVTSLTGETLSATNSFDTINSTNYQWEAEDYDFNGGSFIDNPQVNAYNGLGSVAGIDNVQLNLDGGRPFNYRTNTIANPAPGTSPSGDSARSQFTAGTTDYQIGYFGGTGEWLNYTRHYPAGTYNVIGRLASGNGSPALPELLQVTGGWGTTNQTTNVLGTFTVPSNGWEAWEWCPLLDGSGNPVKVTLDGSQTTLKLAGESQGFNANFFILTPTTANVVPAPLMLKVTASGANANLSFYAQTGYTYQIQYKTNLTDASWINLGGPISGNNTTNTIPDSIGQQHRFYRIHP